MSCVESYTPSSDVGLFLTIPPFDTSASGRVTYRVAHNWYTGMNARQKSQRPSTFDAFDMNWQMMFAPVRKRDGGDFTHQRFLLHVHTYQLCASLVTYRSNYYTGHTILMVLNLVKFIPCMMTYIIWIINHLLGIRCISPNISPSNLYNVACDLPPPHKRSTVTPVTLHKVIALLSKRMS